jgi:membrane protease YdiL (CAAX protease family)
MDGVKMENQVNYSNPKNTWKILILPCALLLLITVIFSLYFVFTLKGDGAAIGTEISNSVPYILSINYTLLLITFSLFLYKDKITFRQIGFTSRGFTNDLIIGAMCGIIIFLLTKFVLNPIFLNIGGNGFFSIDRDNSNFLLYVASVVVLAPFAQEIIFRGYGITKLQIKWGSIIAIIVTGVFFSLLHFGEGVGSMLIAFIVGCFLGFLFVWRKSMTVNITANALSSLLTVLMLILQI